MRILHANKFVYRRGGAEGYMMDVATLQRERGHTVELWGMAHQDNDPVPLAHTFPPQLDFDDPDGGPLHAARLAARMTWSTSARQGMQAALDEFAPDVVHLHNIYHQLSPSILVPVRDAGIPVVMTVHDYKLVCPSYQLLADQRPCTDCLDGSFRHAISRRCKDGSVLSSAMLAAESTFHRAAGNWDPVQVLICPSRFMRGMLERGGFQPERLHHLPHFVFSGLEPKTRAGGPLLAAGRLATEKGFDSVIRALGRLPDDVRLEIAGDGPDQAQLERLAAEHAPGRVVFHGRVSRDRLVELMRASTALVVASQWYENQPMIVLEASTVGLPVIATAIGGLTELVEEPDNGWLVPVHDDAALATAMGEAAADPDGALARGMRARSWVIEEFAPDVHLDRLEAVYAGVGADTGVNTRGGMA